MTTNIYKEPVSFNDGTVHETTTNANNLNNDNSAIFQKIDIHTHILPYQLPDMKEKSGHGGWISLHPSPNGNLKMMIDDKFFREIEPNCWSPEKRIKECDAHGVQIQILSTIPVLFSYWAKPEDCLYLSQYLNDHISGIVHTYPDRFWGLGTVPMHAPELAIQEMRRCIQELGLRGIQIGSHINDWNLDTPELLPFWKACQDLDCPIFVHPWDMQTDGRMSKYWFPWLIGMPCETTIAISSLIIGGILEKFPKLKFSFAHGCGSFPYTCARIQHGHQVRPDLCATECKTPPLEFMDRIYSDSLVHDEDALVFLIKKLGIDKIMLGSDYPFPLGEHHPGLLIEKSTQLSQKQKEHILGLNAMKFFQPRVEQNGITSPLKERPNNE